MANDIELANIAKTDDDDDQRRTIGTVDESYYIIGVGASAGGLQAIKQLISHVDERKFQHSFVIIQHLAPDHKSLMTEILSRETNLGVQEVTDNMLLAPGNIYLIPPKTNVVIQGTIDDTQPKVDSKRNLNNAGLRFSLVAPAPRPQLNLPIDVFFNSLAEAVGERAVGIVLSGTGSDGSRGLMAIKERDGFAMVQDPLTAEFDGMPNSAIASNYVDLVSAPDALVEELLRYIELRNSGMYDVEQLFRDGGDTLTEILAEVSRVADIDFSKYKSPTLKRRIARRMVLNNLTDLQDYLEFAKDSPNEFSVLHREFLVGVTNFFRDKRAWEDLAAHVVPELFKDQEASEPIKVWSVGCSTGEEAYSIAFMLEKYRNEHGIKRDFRVFASDVNEDSIRSARDGIYPESVFDEIPAEYRSPEFLTHHNGTFHIDNAIRGKVIFTAHDVLQDPPYINTDLITCRNLLIYLSNDVQKKILSLFAFSLKSDGILFLGAAEMISQRSFNFKSLLSGVRIFQNNRTRHRRAAGAGLEPLRQLRSPLPRMRRLASRENAREGGSIGPLLEDALNDIDGCILIIDEVGRILETIGNYREFINLPDQAFSANAFDLVHDRLKSAISLLVRRAASDRFASTKGIKCAFSDRVEQVDVFCRKIDWQAQPVAYSILIQRSAELLALTQLDAPVLSPNNDEQAYIAKLESDIEALQEMLSITTEDLGISNEELQTANEELTVSNEELQAKNEEMQSINEELHTVNAENSDKIVQLEFAHADIENLLNTAEFAVLFLDPDLNIRRFNNAIKKYFDLKDSDHKRSINSFASNFDPKAHASLFESINQVRNGGSETRQKLLLKDGGRALVRVRPVRVYTMNDKVGVAVSALDITPE